MKGSLKPHMYERTRFTRALARLDDPPTKLWFDGHESSLSLLSDSVARVAIVGARSCSPYGAQIARTWAEELASYGVAVVSGLARGIDGEAHRGSLTWTIPDEGTTPGPGLNPAIAVLGCGIDSNYPAAHEALGAQLRGRGLVLSEYPDESPPAPWRFPARNRIVAAISDVLLVVEARQQSGALITANFAMEIGVPILAVPGEVTSHLSEGPNTLIHEGHARAVLTPMHVIDRLSLVLDTDHPIHKAVA